VLLCGDKPDSCDNEQKTQVTSAEVIESLFEASGPLLHAVYTSISELDLVTVTSGHAGLLHFPDG